MIVTKVVMQNFRSFEGVNCFTFDKINLIKGNNGSGKSTLGRIAILFAIYGEYEDTLARLITRGKDKTNVGINIIDNDDVIVIQRSIPAKLSIQCNDVEILDGALNSEKDKWLRKRFGEYTYFKKFRMIDKDNSINILDEGSTALRKTLVSIHEDMLNSVKKRLSDKKSLYDKYNRDLLVSKHYPSENRLYKLIQAQKEIALKQKEAKDHFDKNQIKRNEICTTIGKLKFQISSCKTEIEKISKDKCYACGQTIHNEKRNIILIDLETKLLDLEDSLKIANTVLINHDAVSKEIDQEYFLFSDYSTKIALLKNKLETRLKQREYKYTNRDVLNVNRAMKELELFYSKFIMMNVKNLEPIINNITQKIDLEVFFDFDSKGNFDIKVKKNQYEDTFSYKDLSSGQRLVLSIAFQMAILIDKNESGLIIADEGFNNLSEETAKMIFNIFENSNFQLIAILHRFDDVDEKIKVINL